LHRPEGKENHHHDLVDQICKTSIPGSNPGGASKILKKTHRLFPGDTIKWSQMFPSYVR
jgi:hypothetical protein